MHIPAPIVPTQNRITKSFDGEVGGGPGSEHCYTSGLTNLFFLTGEQTYKNAALQLTDWIQRGMNGSGGVFERLSDFARKDVKVIKQIIKSGPKPVFKYPLTRATGNYLSATLDGYSLTGDLVYRERAATIIRKTFHPSEDISLRELDDVEGHGLILSFCKLLRSICSPRLRMRILTTHFISPRDAFLHYANWMARNEKPFLADPAKLDFPNLTWVAQDLRKAYIFDIASCISPAAERAHYTARGEFFRKYVMETLNGDPLSQQTRVLILLMQNTLPSRENLKRIFDPRATMGYPVDHGAISTYRLGTYVLHALKDLVRRFSSLSIRREMRWLKFRITS